MNLQRIIQVLIVVIVLVVAFNLLVKLLAFGAGLLSGGLKLLAFLVILVIGLRFVQHLAQQRR